MKAIIYILAGIVFAALGQLLFKIGANSAGETDISNVFRLLNLYVVTGMVLYGLSAVLWVMALSVADLTYVYPFTALTFVLVYLLSFLVLKESFHLNRLIGAGIIALGIFVMFIFEK